MSAEIIPLFGDAPTNREVQRFEVLHLEQPDLEKLPANLGTPAEWLGTAISHLKCAICAQPGGTVTVSGAALDLVIIRLEELDHGGEPWKGNVA